MPIYEYECESCHHEFELLIRGDEKPVCPQCGKQKVRKQLSVPSAPVSASNAPPSCAGPQCGANSCCGKSCGLGGMM